ncbi:hypothetical protein IGS68_06415 [Skermanella sp. TT6]|uniref:Uncharacterized protein n=1 Tax=Skermanella cutis TaxID=2775420 RepID=A0ABX7BB77_9PROT|nr:hypothetical protein [Skermanella sp. TT6]QQP90855.1 hypothetical protein IGS68_06415 [Skermanella sp. TT6]
MDVAGFRFAVETLERGRWSVLCLMADDIAAARMAYSLMTLYPFDGVRLALFDPALDDRPERVIWEHLKATGEEGHDAINADDVLDLTPLPEGHFPHDDGGEEGPRSFRLGSEPEIDDPGAVARHRLSRGRSAAAPKAASRLWPPGRRLAGRAIGAGLVISGIFGAALLNLPERPSPRPPEQPLRLADLGPARPEASAPPVLSPAPVPVEPAAADPAPAEPASGASPILGKWAKDTQACANDFLIFRPDSSILVDARLALASGGPVFYGTEGVDITVFDETSESRYRALAPDRLRQVSYFSSRTGLHEGGPTLVRCPDAEPPPGVEWAPDPIDRATALSRLDEARSRFEAARAVAGTPSVPAPLRGRWGARCDIGYLQWEDGVQTSWSTFGGDEKRAISAYKELGTRFTIVFEGGYTQFYDLVADDQIVLAGIGAQGVMTDPAPPPWTGRRCPLPAQS